MTISKASSIDSARRTDIPIMLLSVLATPPGATLMALPSGPPASTKAGPIFLCQPTQSCIPVMASSGVACANRSATPTGA